MRFGEALRTLVPGAVLMNEDSASFEGTRVGFALTRAPDSERGLFGTLDLVLETDGGWVVAPGVAYEYDEIDGDDWRVLRPRPVPDRGVAAPVFGVEPQPIAPMGVVDDYVRDAEQD